MWPLDASSRITRSASAPSGTFSTYLVAILLPNCFSIALRAEVVLVRPPRVADRAHVHERDLQRLLSDRGTGERERRGGAEERRTPSLS